MGRLRTSFSADPFDREIHHAVNFSTRILDKLMALCADKGRDVRRGKATNIDPKRLRLLTKQIIAIRYQLENLPTVALPPKLPQPKIGKAPTKTETAKTLGQRRVTHDFNEGEDPRLQPEPSKRTPGTKKENGDDNNDP